MKKSLPFVIVLSAAQKQSETKRVRSRGKFGVSADDWKSKW